MCADQELRPEGEGTPRPAAWVVTSDRDVEGEVFPPGAEIRPGPPGGLGGLSQGDMRQKLREAAFPATRNDLLRQIGPDTRGQLAAHLRSLPPDVVFADVNAVMNAFGGIGNSQ